MFEMESSVHHREGSSGERAVRELRAHPPRNIKNTEDDTRKGPGTPSTTGDMSAASKESDDIMKAV